MAVPLKAPPITAYVPARHQWAGARAPRVFCLHVPVFPERMDGAERIAEYFRTTDRVASTHFCTDPDSIIRCIPDGRRGASAKGINSDGIHVEMTGYANQTSAQWMDDYSVATMERTAELFALYYHEYGIPIQFVGAEGLRRGERGITTHAEAWKAYGGSFRSDPGEYFPMNYFLALCREAVGGISMVGVDFVKKGDGVDKVDRPAVRYWQRILRTLGVYTRDDGSPGALDGIYGDNMAQAVAEVTGEDGERIHDKEAFRIHRALIRGEIAVAIKELPGGGPVSDHTHEVTVGGVV